jgi:uncharacterized protein
MEASTYDIAVQPTQEVRAAGKTGDRTLPQLGLGAIIGIWAAAALPMAALAWIVAPILADQFSGPAPLGRALLITLTAGLIWQFALVMALVAREQGTLRFSVLKEALWLRAPRSPRTGRIGGRLWLVVVPLVLLFGLQEMLPDLGAPAARDMASLLESDAGQDLFAGAWAWFALVAVLGLFNTVLGEELLFRGYLLPRMNGAFGRGDWIANGVLFGVYHLHVPWAIPGALTNALVLSYPSKRYRSALIGIVVHSAQTIVILGLVLALVLTG